MQRYCTGTAPVLHRYFTGTAPVQHRYCTDAAPVKHGYFTGTALGLLHRYCTNAAPVLRWHHTAPHWHYTGTKPVKHWHCTTARLALYWHQTTSATPLRYRHSAMRCNRSESGRPSRSATSEDPSRHRCAPGRPPNRPPANPSGADAAALTKPEDIVKPRARRWALEGVEQPRSPGGVARDVAADGLQAAVERVQTPRKISEALREQAVELGGQPWRCLQGML